MANFKKELEGVEITAEDRKNLTPEQVADLERLLKQLREEEIGEADLSSEKFDAKDMRPADSPGPVRWRLIDDPPSPPAPPPTPPKK